MSTDVLHQEMSPAHFVRGNGWQTNLEQMSSLGSLTGNSVEV